jgi:hypothetical protein
LNRSQTCFSNIWVLVENLFHSVGVDVDVVVLDQGLQPVVVVENPFLVVIPEMFFDPLCLSFSYTHSLSLSLSHSLTLSYMHSLSLTHSLPYIYTHTHTHTFHSFSLSHTLCHNMSFPFTLSLSLLRSSILSLSLH